MEKVTEKKVEKKSRHGADFGLRIAAVIIAIIVWFILSTTQYPTITKTITGIAVSLPSSDTSASEKGLSAMNFKTVTVNAEIKGMNYEIGNYTASDLTATVNVDSVTKAGTYTLDIDVKSNHTTDKCTVVSVSPKTVNVTFDRKTTKVVPVSAEAPLISAENGYSLKDTTVTPEEITVEGAKNDLDKLSKAVVQISKSQKLYEDTNISSTKIKFYDTNDNELDSSKYEVKNQSSYDVSFVVYKKKTAELKVDISDCPDNFDTTTLPMKLSEKEIAVISPNLDDSSTEKINVGVISLSDINLSKSYTFSIPLAEGEINLNGTKNVTVTFDSKGYSCKTFSVAKSHIKLLNKPSGKKVTIETKQLTGVKLYGPTASINKIKASDLYAQVDLSEVYNTGSYAKSSTVYSSKLSDVWSYGKNDVQIVIS